MNKIILVSLLIISSFVTFGGEPKEKFRVECPKCNSVMSLVPCKKQVNGGISKGNGTIIQQSSLFFKCPVCKNKFQTSYEETIKLPKPAVKISINYTNCINAAIVSYTNTATMNLPPMPRVWRSERLSLYMGK